MTSTQTSPRVSICVPVRNGEKYLQVCLDSILSQTFRDFELILCDNASTDSTETICRAAVAADPRVQYFRHAANIGPAENHNFGLKRARGEYFHWQAHDDLIEPTFLEECVQALDADPHAVAVYPKTLVIDEQNNAVEPYDFFLNTDSPSVCRRFRQLILVRNALHRNYEIFALFRTPVMQDVGGEGSWAHADRVCTVEVALRGPLRMIESRLFRARWHAGQSMQMIPTSAKPNGRRSKWVRWLGTGPLPPPEWWNPALKNRICFPDWKLLGKYVQAVRKAPLGPMQRLGCFAIVGEWVLRYWPKLVRDIAFAADDLVMRLRGGMPPTNAAPLPARVTASPELEKAEVEDLRENISHSA